MSFVCDLFFSERSTVEFWAVSGRLRAASGQLRTAFSRTAPQDTTRWKGYFAECRTQNAESYQGVICGKLDADFFRGMKGKVRNESMRNVAEMNIY